jgi:hypothetical protein
MTIKEQLKKEGITFRERVSFGLNSIPKEKVKEFVEKVEEFGECEAHWACTGRTRHEMLAYQLSDLLPQYNFEIDYQDYECIARKK